MAALRYKDEHNKVGYLLKPTKSDDYHQIIDFLRASHIRYALTHNLIIFDSLVKQFWSMATLRAHELGPPAILATIDKTPYTITEDLVRSRLQLADDGGMVSNIWNAKKFLMYPRFLQAILGIETRVTRQYKVLVLSRKLFTNMKLNFAGHHMPLLPAMLLQAQAGEGVEIAAQAIPQPVPTPDQSLVPLSTPSRQQTSNPIPLVLEHGQSSDLHTASFSRSHDSDAGQFTTVEDAHMGDDFHTSPPRSSQAPPTGQPSGGVKDTITLTALSSVVSTLVHKVHSLESELKDHKKLFKDVVGKLVKKVKALVVKLKTKKKKMVVSDSEQQDGGKHDIDLDALHAFANAAPKCSTNVPSSVALAGVSSKGKSLMVEEDIPVKARTFKQMEEDRLGEEATKRLYDEEMAQTESQRAEIEANASLSKTLLGDDMSKDDFPARMAALIKKKRQAPAVKLAQERQNRPMTLAQQKAYMIQYVKNQSSAIYNTGWTMAYMKSFTDDQLKQEFEKIRKSTEALIPSPPEIPHSPAVVVNKDSNDEDSDNEVWSAVVGWEILHMVDRQDLVKLYGLVVQYYENHPVAGARLIFWGDLQVLFDS
uniref:Ribonuclease H-like domain-containing protein n=1 Tax=Tanacetum cinerariifolium TaxID=118510 RepID=A0A6L2MSC1_TANCI|nr:ribonuclease H-like domain-containing protein [Tanacetum cinerariifolium]